MDFKKGSIGNNISNPLRASLHMAKGNAAQALVEKQSYQERSIFTPNINLKRQCFSDYNVATEAGVANIALNTQVPYSKNVGTAAISAIN